MLKSLSIKNVTSGYGKQGILNNFNLSLSPGEVFVLLGPNGAGKTTLVKTICGHINPQFGTIDIFGTDSVRSPELRRQIGVVPQENALFNHLTVTENLDVFARLSGVPRREIRSAVSAILSRTHLETKANILVQKLSGGYRKRVNIAAGIVHSPQILLMDEPTVGIDIDAREAIHDLIRHLKDSETTILLTTHDFDQASSLADRIGFILDGQLVGEGTPEKLIQDVFRDNQEHVLVFERAPYLSGSVILQKEGFKSIHSGRIWCGKAKDKSDYAARLLDAGLAVKEWRLREPDLKSLFRHYSGQEVAS